VKEEGLGQLMHGRAGDELLQKAGKTVSQCDRCGACLPVCPLFGEKDHEFASARGKNAMVRALAEGGLEPTRDLLARVDFCLLCRACVEACPNQIATDQAMIDLRQYLKYRMGYKNVKQEALAAVLDSRTAVKLAAGLLAFCRRRGLNGLFSHSLLPEEFTRAHFLAAHAGPAALGQKTPIAGLKVTGATKVAYFQGCGMRLLFPAAAARTCAILAATAPLVQRANACCGLPHLAHGKRREFLALARNNIRLYEGSDIIVSDCASCSSMLKHLGAWLEDDPAWKDRAALFSGKVMDLTEYLAGIGYRPPMKADVTLTYHAPCHLVRGQGISAEPRALLQAAGNFVELPEADRCCGGAGSFHLDYPEISSQILERKRKNIERTGAAIVVTGCPGCLIQLTRAAKKSGHKFKALHISQII